jgi:hypothetical protein
VIKRNAGMPRSSAPFGLRWWLRPGAWFGLAALCLNLLGPLVLVAEAAPADAGTFICHATPAAESSAPASAAGGAHHCPLCLVLAGGAVAPPGIAPVAALPSPAVLIQPHHAVPTLPTATIRLNVPQSRAPPAA